MKSSVALFVSACFVSVSCSSGVRLKRSDANESWIELHKAANSGNLQQMADLLKSGIDINATDKDKWTPLHIAARIGNENVVRLLIENGANVNAKSGNSRTPLHEASFHGKIEVAKVLIEKGAEVNAKDIGDWRPLHLSAQDPNIRSGKAEVARLLLENGADLHAVDRKFKRTAIFEAAVYGQVDVARVLIEKGARVNDEDNWKYTCLHVVSQMAHLKKGKGEITRLLLENGANVNAVDGVHHRTPIFDAAVNGQFEVAKALIENGAEVNAKDIGDWTPLHGSAQNENIKIGKAEVAKLLLDNGADVKAIDKTYKRTPLHEAAIYGHAGVAEVMVINNADVNAQDYEKCIPLHLATQNWVKRDDKVEIVKVLLRYGSYVNAKSANGRTPLVEAINNDQIDSVRVLLENRADVNEVDNDNRVPLHFAAEKGNEKIVKLLLGNGAHKSIKNKNGESPVDIAIRFGHYHIKNLFQSDIVRSVQEACQSYSADRITHGEIAADEEFPWMAALGYINERDYKITFDCGGTIISNKFLLTAAHCVKVKIPIVVRLGKTSLIDSDDEEDIRAINRNIKSIITHPRHSSITKQNDIALIRVKNKITFSSYIMPACLQTDLRDEPSDTKLIVTGWGIISPEKNIKSTILRKTELTSMPLSQCNSTMINWNRAVNDAGLRNGLIEGQYCAYDPNGRRDSCQGDSGGPLQYFTANKTVATVVGIVSFGVGCGSSLPAIYTRVAYYLDWIEPIVWQNV
ncbi:serine/threonine-protein phosphatase 6 regulatory ankyrin repeat subunit C-like [Contarinia nasturtii]|uniref:serine/threonine-protein phosphatase 6 regulatory ankyrin repeat subunit C-like n=1 Tax=Contarinia nasturtii TaxID=265458 RepID=UPI0012D4732D|nr:serine/threonine-protein phosphatase 6 regulatory ankyrin repeat subunit C-like [Contarinia nasturtii]